MKFAGKKFLNTLSISSILFLQTIGYGTQSNPQENDTIKFTQKILRNEITKMIAETGIPSISIAVVKNQDVVWAEAFGYANVKTKTPATISSAYSTGSTVKPFMSMAIIQLVEKGLVDLDKPVNDYLKKPIASFSENSKPITLRHLLSHQSGLPSEAIFLDLWGDDHRKTLDEIVCNLKPIRAPEEEYMYCNNGFVIAALVIENITGTTYGEYVHQFILTPLQLDYLNFVKPTPATVEEIAFPYKTVYNKPLPIDQLYSEPYPSGGLTFMTPSQMARFLITHLNEGVYAEKRLVSAKLMEQFHETSFGNEYYGLGIGIEKKNGMTYLFHNGLQPGYSAVFILNLNLQTGVYLVANAASEKQLNSLATLAIDLMDGDKNRTSLPSFATKEFKKIGMDEGTAKKFVGTYKIEGTELSLIIFKRNNKLYLRNPINSEYEILPYDQGNFFLKTAEEQVEFISGKNGVDGMILYSNGGKTFASRIK